MNYSERSHIGRVVIFTVVILLLVIGSIAGIGAAQTGEIDALGSPEINTYAPHNEYTPGSQGALTVQIGNEGDFKRGSASDRRYVTTARDVAVTLDASGTPLTVKTGTQSIGELSESRTASPEFNVEIPESASPGTYELTVNIDYAYASKARSSPSLRAQTSESSRSISRTVTVEISDDPQFKLTRADNSRLRADETSLLDVTVENTGGQTARDIAVSLSSQSSAIIFNSKESDVARVDSLAPGDTAEVTYEAAVKPDAPARLYELTGTASYTDAQGINGRDEDLSVGAEVAPRRDDFTVATEESVVTVGSSRLIAVEVTNNRDQRLTDIEASLGTSDPLDSDDDKGYIAALDPGESETITFELSATGDANPKTYAAAVDFRYDDARDISRMSETYQLPIDVETDDGMELTSISPLTIVIALAVVAGVYGAAVYTRTRPELLPWR